MTAAGTVTYAYNAFEQRVSKSGPGAVVPTGAAYYVYDEGGQLLGEYDAVGSPLYETVYLNASPVGVLKQSGSAGSATLAVNLYNVYTDHLATPRVITRPSDEVIVWRWDTAEPFGATAPDDNPSALGAFTFNQRMPGQVFDAESGLFQNWYREYNPRPGGRYMQPDPIGQAGGINLFAYVNGDPLRKIDPLGLLDSLHFDGKTLTGYDDAAVEFSVPATSGPWGKGKLPDGVYDANTLRRRNDRAMTCPDGSGWSLNLDPMFKTKRDLLRIHPDGNVPGTEGCIGPACSEQKNVYDALKQFFDNNPGVKTIPLTVTYRK